MTVRPFLQCRELLEAGFEHGFGTRESGELRLDRAASVRQVHGTDMARAPFGTGDAGFDAGAAEQEAPRADAVFTSQPGLAVVVVTADCVPILLADRRGRAVAAVHAGWRGSVAGIAERSVGSLCARAGVEPGDLIVAIGPHIGACCYEVDQPVIRCVSEPGVLRESARAERAMLDLFALNRAQLLRAGVREDSILRVAACTHCDPRFHSYRRDGTGGRMQHYLRMPAAAGAGPASI